jgi:hypothetical protein
MQLSLDAVKTLESLNHRLTHLECKLGMHGMNPDANSRYALHGSGGDNPDGLREEDTFVNKEMKRWIVRFDSRMNHKDKEIASESGVWIHEPLILMGSKSGKDAPVVYHLNWRGLVTPKFYHLKSELDMSAAVVHLFIWGSHSGAGSQRSDVWFTIEFSDGTRLGFSRAY